MGPGTGRVAAPRSYETSWVAHPCGFVLRKGGAAFGWPLLLSSMFKAGNYRAELAGGQRVEGVHAISQFVIA